MIDIKFNISDDILTNDSIEINKLKCITVQ